MRTIALQLVLMAALAGSSLSATAQQRGIDRPFYAISGYVLQQKTFAVESGFRATVVNRDAYQFEYQSLKVRFATLNTMEMFVALRVPATVFRGPGGTVHRSGFASPATGLKIIMKKKEEGQRMGMAFMGMVETNFGSKDFRNTKLLPQFRIAMDIDWNERTNMRVNYGVQWQENPAVTDAESNPAIDPYITVALSTAGRVSDKLTVFGEAAMLVKYNDFSQAYYLNGGLIVHLRDNVQLDISGGAGLSPDSPRGLVQIGFGGIWPKKNLAGPVE